MNQKSLPLEKGWKIAIDPQLMGKENHWELAVQKDAVDAYVPSIIQQFYPDYNGVAYYWCSFVPELSVEETECAHLWFGGVDYKAEVWLNGTYLGEYEGGETPFSFDVTETLIKEKENLLAVRVINPMNRDIDGLNLMNTPHRNKVMGDSAGSHYNHGGIWYEVSLFVTPKIYMEDNFLTGNIQDGTMTIRTELVSKSKEEETVTYRVAVFEKQTTGAKVVEKEWSFGVKEGVNKEEVTLQVPNHSLWDIDNPFLYRVEISLESSVGVHKRSVNFGFRQFDIRDGVFHLNGKKLFVKCAHSGNCFPIGQMFPVRPEHVRQDMIYAKAAGFNMVRAISGLFRPEQMDIADEMGLLIYEECYASWCMAYSAGGVWENEEELAQISAQHPDMPIDDEAAMLARWEHATAQMVRRDRNHASVVVWGLLNETSYNSVFRTAVAFLPKLRELDPSRAVVLNSGRFDRDFSIGSASNPYCDQWENTWGEDGNDAFSCQREYPADINYAPIPLETGDNHFYVESPLKQETLQMFRTLGATTPKPIFLSEFGVGSVFHVIEEAKHFKQYGLREDLIDYKCVASQGNALAADWDKLGLAKVFPFPEMMLKESQHLNADERKRNLDMLRSNPNLVGYSMTGLLDHGMCGEGLWSYWRVWKPEMFDAISDGFAPLRFCLFATDQVYRNKPMEIEAVLANEGILPTGTYTADFAIVGPQGTVISFTEVFELDGDAFAVPVMKKEITLDVPEGKYQLVSSLREGAARGLTRGFYVFDEANDKDLSGKKASYVALPEEALNYLAGQGLALAPYTGEEEGLILVGTASKEELEMVIAVAKKGATVALLCGDIFKDNKNADLLKEITTDLHILNMGDWLYHKEVVLADKEVCAGLGQGLLDMHLIGDAFPHLTFETAVVPQDIMAVAFTTGYPGIPGAYAMAHCLAGFAVGEGKVLVNSFGLLNYVGNPAADRLLSNLVDTKTK